MALPSVEGRTAGPGPIRPDAEQARVLAHDRGPMLVTGAPGTGKTFVLRERLARLLEAGADPERVVLVVGSRRARREGREALMRRVRASLPDLRVVTIHALAHSVVLRHFQSLGYAAPPDVLNASEQFGRVRELLLGEDPAGWPAYGSMLKLRGFVDQVRQFLLRAQEALLQPDDLEEKARAAGLTGWREVAGFYRRYLQVLDDQVAVDYAGLVQQAAAAASKGPPPFDHLLVDDYQDTTFAAERLLAELRPQSLVVAGDPEGHVFSFQGTTDQPIRRFTDRFPGARHLTLTTNHRSPEAARVEAWFTPHSSEEHAAVARELRRLHVEEAVPWGELAVVFRRAGTHMGGLLRALDDAGVPRALPERGLSLLAEPATYPFVLAFRWLARANERDALVESILASDLAGLSPAGARGLLRRAQAGGGPASAALDQGEGLSLEERGRLEELRDVLRSAEAVAERSALDAFAILWRGLEYARRLVAGGEESREGRRALDAAVAFSRAVATASEKGGMSVAAFLDLIEAGQEGPGLTQPLDETVSDAVRIHTAHGVVGQEFDTVIVVGTVEGNFPSLSRPEPMFDLGSLERRITQSQRNRLRLEDERRLFGVVTTRGRRRVLLTASDPHGQDLRLSARSRFVPGRAWRPAPSAPGGEALTAAEAQAAWRRTLADPGRSPVARLSALEGIRALGVDCARWWYQRDWTGTDRPLHQSIRVSHSKLESLENCQLQFVLGQELGLEGRAGYHAWVGHLVHRLIEDCENGLITREEGALVAEAERRWREQEFPSHAVSEAFRRLVTGTMLPAWFREYGGARALEQELRFTFQFGQAEVTGVIDRIGPVGSGGVQITDYKTGKSRNATAAEENLQLGIYFLAVSQAPELAEFRPVRAVELAFLRDQEWRSKDIARTSKAFVGDGEHRYAEAMRDRLTGLVELLQRLQASETYRPSSTANCRFCHFKTLCPLWPEGRDVFPMGQARSGGRT